jgi:hypothetical protein
MISSKVPWGRLSPSRPHVHAPALVASSPGPGPGPAQLLQTCHRAQKQRRTWSLPSPFAIHHPPPSQGTGRWSKGRIRYSVNGTQARPLLADAPRPTTSRAVPERSTAGSQLAGAIGPGRLAGWRPLIRHSGAGRGSLSTPHRTSSSLCWESGNHPQ